MTDPKIWETMEIKQKDKTAINVKLADYFEIIGSPVRLSILKMLMEEPMDVQFISRRLWENGITSVRENTKNHLDKLLSVGLVFKRAGVRDNRAVMQYVLVPGSIELSIRTLYKVLKTDLKFETKTRIEGVREKLSSEFPASFASIKVLGGKDDGCIFTLRKEEVKIGRIDYQNQEKYDPHHDVVLSGFYDFVTRVSKPHARLSFEEENWFIENCEGKNGTYLQQRKLVNGTNLFERKLEKNRKEKMQNGDIITLGDGAKSVHLLFTLPETKNQ